MSPGQSIDLLSRVPLFSELSREELERIEEPAIGADLVVEVRAG